MAYSAFTRKETFLKVKTCFYSAVANGINVIVNKLESFTAYTGISLVDSLEARLQTTWWFRRGRQRSVWPIRSENILGARCLDWAVRAIGPAWCFNCQPEAASAGQSETGNHDALHRSRCWDIWAVVVGYLSRRPEADFWNPAAGTEQILGEFLHDDHKAVWGRV